MSADKELNEPDSPRGVAEAQGSDYSKELLIKGEIIREKPDPKLVEELLRILELLHPREEGVLSARFGLKTSPPKTYTQIAEEFAVSAERIREVEGEAIARILDLRISLGLRVFLT